MAKNKPPKEVLESLKETIAKVPGMRLATKEETEEIIDHAHNDPHLKEMRRDMAKPDYNSRLRDLTDGWYKEAASRDLTLDTLPAFLSKLADYRHDYNTIVHAVAAAALAAAKAMDRSKHGGITGFQAGAVFWEFYRQWLYEKGPAKIVKFHDMLFPQNEDHFQKTIREETMEYLKTEAKALLAEPHDWTHKDVIEHWESIAEGVVPFGYKIEER